MTNLPRNLSALLRDAGLEVVEVKGYPDRGRPGSFAPVGVLNHHTGASAKGWSLAKELGYAKWMFLVGRSDLPAPLCNIALGRSGTVYVGAAGRTNHGGKAKASGSVAAGDANSLYVGIEWMLSGSEMIPAEMYKAAVTLNAVLTQQVTKTSVRTISAHYQTSVTGKWDIGDPDGVRFKDKRVLDMDRFRKAVQVERDRLAKPAVKPRKRTPRRPVRVVEVNGDSASGRKPAHSDRILRAAADHADVILGCEFFNIDAAKSLGPNWIVEQRGRTGSADASYIVAVRRARGEVVKGRLRLGSASLLSVGVRKRSWLTAWVEIDGRDAMPFSSGHAPPKRAWLRWPAYMAAAPGGVVGADFNKWRRAVKVRFPRRVVRQPSRELLGIVIPKRIPSTRARRLDVGGDHHAVAVTLWP